MQHRRADVSALPARVADKPSEALPLLENRLEASYGSAVAELVLRQLEAWDDTGYSSEYTAVLWDVAAELTGQPIAEYDDLQRGVDAWRSDGVVFQPTGLSDERKRRPDDPTAVRNAVRDVMSISRHTAQARFGQYATVYRGVFDNVWHRYVTETNNGVVVEEPAAMEAWTRNKDFAERHGDHTLQLTVDTSDVLFLGALFQERQHYRMQELTLGHGKYEADAVNTVFS